MAVRPNEGSTSPAPVARRESPESSGPTHLIAYSEFAGPLPHPDILAGYDEVVDNGAERIMKMAERRAAHREYVGRKYASAQAFRMRFAPVSASVIVLAALVGGMLLIYFDKEIYGLTSMTGALAALVGSILAARIANKDRARRPEHKGQYELPLPDRDHYND